MRVELKHNIGPRDEMERLAEYNGHTGTGGSLLAGVNLPGIDKNEALARFCGDETAFINALRYYSSFTRPLLERLDEYLTTENLEEYTIVVHGIKGSSYSISAKEVGGLARELEAAAQLRDLKRVVDIHRPFIERAEALIHYIHGALSEINTAADKPTAPAPAPALLRELRDACKAYDMDGADAAIEKLEAFRYENGGELVAWLRGKINEMAFEEIACMVIPDIPARGLPSLPAFTAPEADILIVDDDETNLKIALSLFAPFKLRMDAASSGKEALRMISEKDYHAVFMDYMMPAMDGAETIRQLRHAERGKPSKLPVIALTASEDAYIYDILRQAGADDFIIKPMNAGIIREQLRRWLPGELLREQRSAQPSGAPAAMLGEQDADLPVIEGIDVQAGMNYLGGKKHLITALKNFYMLIDNHAHRIESLLKEGMLREATTEVHALKSAALLIGAGELSMRFRRLERYGLEENLEAFKREAPAVIELYRSYKIFLKPLGDKAEGEKKPAAKKDLISILDAIKSAVDHFDIDGVDYAMKQLDEYRLPDECRPHMDALRLCAADVAVEEVLAMAEIIKGIITLLREDAN